MKLIFILLLVFSLLLIIITACNTADYTEQKPVERTESEAFKKGKRQLEVQGYKNVTEVPYPLFCCAEEDSFILSTGFEAQAPDGEIIKGCFCVKGIIRNSVTIRFE